MFIDFFDLNLRVSYSLLLILLLIMLLILLTFHLEMCY